MWSISDWVSGQFAGEDEPLETHVQVGDRVEEDEDDDEDRKMPSLSGSAQKTNEKNKGEYQLECVLR